MPLTTNSNVLAGLLESIKLVLYSNTEVIANTLQVNVINIENDAIIINIYCYIDIVDYPEFLKFKTKANISLLKLLEEKNIELAYPGRDIYMKNTNLK